jgi:diguanylate cyclase (GGDEF)-like protein
MKSRLALDKQNEELRKLATKDPLTNCLNRRSFYELAEHAFHQASTFDLPLSCIMFDIDHFKQVNDQHGHATGDKVIIAIAKIGFTGLRAQDLLCRYGGEEFCILLPEADLEIGLKLAERLRKEVELKVGLNVLETGGDIAVTSSFGVSTLTPKIKGLAELIDVADKALYKAKRTGRNKIVSA